MSEKKGKSTGTKKSGQSSTVRKDRVPLLRPVPPRPNKPKPGASKPKPSSKTHRKG